MTLTLQRGFWTPPAAGGAVETDVIWTGLSNATDDGGGVITSTATPNTGGRGTVALDATQAFDVITRFPGDVDGKAFISFIDDDNGTNYGYDASNDYLCGCFLYYGDFFRTEIGGTGVDVGPLATSFPFYARMRKSGDDVILATSTDGTNYTDQHTFSGVLSGQSTIYIKALQVEAAGRSIKVSYIQ